MKPSPLYVRLRAIWFLLTKPWFVVITANKNADTQAHYNVNYQSFRLMARVIDMAYEEQEAGNSLMRQVQDQLKPKQK